MKQMRKVFLGFAVQAGFEMGTVEGVALPHVVGVGLGEGETGLGALLTGGLEQIEAHDDAAEGVGGDLRTLEQAALDAGAIDFGDVGAFVVEGREDLFDGF